MEGGGEDREGINGFKVAGNITEATAFSFETTEQSIIGVQKLANRFAGSSKEILNAGKIGKLGGVGLGLLSISVTAFDGLKNDWKNHHTADILMTTIEIGLGLFEYTSPIGWGVAGLMFVGNLISEHYTDKTITENLFDK